MCELKQIYEGVTNMILNLQQRKQHKHLFSQQGKQSFKLACAETAIKLEG